MSSCVRVTSAGLLRGAYCPTPRVLAHGERTRRCRYACLREPERLDYGVFVLAAHAADGTVKTNSSPESVLRVDDRLVLFGTEERLRTFASRACADPAVCYPDYRL